MIRTCDKNTFDAYADYFYQLAQNKKNAAFPLYCDGVKTKEDYLKTVYQSFEREDEDLLIYEKDGKVQGLFQIFFIQEDRYSGVQFAVVNGDFAEALQELLKIISEKYNGFTFNVYFSEENESGISFFKMKGYEAETEESVFVRSLKNYCSVEYKNDVVQIGADNFYIFEKVHKRFEDGMYWTSDRIYRCLKDWEIFAKDQGVVFFNRRSEDAEIFGLEITGKNTTVAEDLLRAALDSAKNLGARSMYYFSEKSFETAAVNAGFEKLADAYFYTVNTKEFV